MSYADTVDTGGPISGLNPALAQRLADATNQVFWYLQTDPHQVLYVSPAFDSTWGFPAERLYQDPEFRMLCIHPEDRSRVAAAFADWIQGNTSTYLVEYRIMHPNGSVR